MKFEISSLITMASLVMSILTSSFAFITWYTNLEKKRYGLERDFAHMKRSYDQIELNLNTIVVELDRRFDGIDKEVIEIKSILSSFLKHE